MTHKQPQPSFESLSQSIELLQDIVNQNRAMLEVNKQVLDVLANSGAQCSYANEEKE